MKTNEQMC